MSFQADKFGASGPGIPALGLRITVPDVFIDSGRGRSIHRKVMQDATRETLEWHHRSLMPQHFKQTARGKYGHKERAPVTKARKRKRFGSITDLVKSRKSKTQFTSEKPRVSFRQGTPEGVIHGYMRYKWPFPQASRRTRSTPRRVSQFDMNAEVTRWTDRETREGSERCARAFAASYKRRIAGKKKFTKIIAPQL